MSSKGGTSIHPNGIIDGDFMECGECYYQGSFR